MRECPHEQEFIRGTNEPIRWVVINGLGAISPKCSYCGMLLSSDFWCRPCTKERVGLSVTRAKEMFRNAFRL